MLVCPQVIAETNESRLLSVRIHLACRLEPKFPLDMISVVERSRTVLDFSTIYKEWKVHLRRTAVEVGLGPNKKNWIEVIMSKARSPSV